MRGKRASMEDYYHAQVRLCVPSCGATADPSRLPMCLFMLAHVAINTG